MRVAIATVAICLLSAAMAQNAPPAQKPVTVPITLDHDRIIVDVDLTLPDRSTKRVRAWVDNGNPEQWMSSSVAGWMGLSITCDGQVCSAKPPTPVVSLEILIGGMKIFLSATREIKVPAGESKVAPGMNADISVPSTVLRNYDVLINFPGHEITIGPPGSVKFQGVKAKVLVSPDNGLIQVPSQIDKKKYNLGLDLGSSISFLTEDLFDKLAATYPDWPHMTGAIGPANMWGLQDEPKWKLMRVGRVQYGPLFLTDVAAVKFPSERENFFEKRAGTPTAGLLGTNALVNYRIGLDYAHSTVFFEIGRTFNFPDFDVIGLILRPDPDGWFTIIGVADFSRKPSVPEVQAGDHLVAVDDISTAGSALGQVWSMLGGEPGKGRTLTVERAGKQFNVSAQVKRFLADTDDSSAPEKSPRKK